MNVGDRVTTVAAAPTGHTRLPAYLRARPGVIEAAHGRCPLADARACGRIVEEPLYTVAFAAGDVWGDAGDPRLTLHAELWESYLVRR
jgi:nitrile hydratase